MDFYEAIKNRVDLYIFTDMMYMQQCADNRLRMELAGKGEAPTRSTRQYPRQPLQTQPTSSHQWFELA